MEETATKPEQTGGTPVPDEAVHFLSAIFEPCDYILIRPIEVWSEDGRGKSRTLYYETRHPRAKDLSGNSPMWYTMTGMAKKERANLYFGVCPRFAGNDKYDRAFQIRIIIGALWCDSTAKTDTVRPNRARGPPLLGA
jgi:hypothetical protein